ncbi:MAG: diaminopimelate decarboxylase, partial [Pseudomonadota bacterium]|nr:diaminopimelate decarboxylase [Pseudomonadota bacterium]
PLPAPAAAIGTPFYCYSAATLERHYKVFSGHFSDMDAMVCYAVKANGNLAILKTLARLGSGADVVSEGEIRLALAAGVDPQRIVFSGVGKTAAEMAFALEKNIFQFNIESEPELRFLSDIAKAKNTKARIAVRVNPDVEAGTHAKISTGHKESKFGVAMPEAMPLYRLAATLPGIEIQGASVHIGSQLTSLGPFAQAFARLRAFAGELRAESFAVKTLDLGGGLGIPYGQEDPPLPAAYADIVKREMKGVGCKIIFEPGRVLVGNAGILVSRVIYVKKSGERIFIVVDAAMNDLLRPSLYGAYHDIVPIAAPPGDAPTELADVAGPICESGDVFAERRLMKIPEAGDLLAFRSAGAYGASMASTYNARPLVAEVMVKGGQYAVVRSRETYEALLKRDTLPSWLL